MLDSQFRVRHNMSGQHETRNQVWSVMSPKVAWATVTVTNCLHDTATMTCTARMQGGPIMSAQATCPANDISG